MMQVRSSLSELEQYGADTSLANEWLSTSESILAEASEVMNRLRELGVRGSTDTMPPESMRALGEEASELLDHLVALANTRHVGRYLFAGNQTDRMPFERDPEADGDEWLYFGDGGRLLRDVGPGMQVQVNVPGDEAFAGLLETATTVRDALFAGDSTTVNENLDALDADQDRLLAIRSQLGSRVNRLEMGERRLEDMKYSLTRVLSDTADVDMAEYIMELTLTERAYQVTLATGARILPQTLR